MDPGVEVPSWEVGARMGRRQLRHREGPWGGGQGSAADPWKCHRTHLEELTRHDLSVSTEYRIAELHRDIRGWCAYSALADARRRSEAIDA